MDFSLSLIGILRTVPAKCWDVVSAFETVSSAWPYEFCLWSSVALDFSHHACKANEGFKFEIVFPVAASDLSEQFTAEGRS